jgi:hypothetical protein
MIREHNEYIESHAPKEAVANEMIGALDTLVPHANISDLIFWGEKERSDEEIATEALLREAIWHEGGDLSLLLHVRSQLQLGLSDTSAKSVHRNYATQMLPKITAEIRRLESGTRH